MRRIIFLIASFVLLCNFVVSQTAKVVGLHNNTPSVFALTNAEVHIEPGKALSQATIVIRDGTIVDVGKRVNIPDDAVIVDMGGYHIYPGFIDLYTSYGMPDSVDLSNPVHWNAQIRSHFRATPHFRVNSKEAELLRSQGFVLANSIPKWGILKGYSTLVSLGEGEANRQIVLSDITQVASFNQTRGFSRNYPSSVMGAIALFRQTFYDAQWHTQAHATFKANPSLPRPEFNQALQDLDIARKTNKPFIIEANNELWLLRANELANEFGLNLWVLGSGFEYRRLDAVKETRKPIILPLNFPKAPEISTPEQSINVSLEELRHWYLAPENPAKLAQAKIPVMLTSRGSGKDFLKNLRTAVERGLDKSDALAALTTTPAKYLGIENRFGTIGKGKVASFTVASGNIFSSQTQVVEVWVDGEKYKVDNTLSTPAGRWIISGCPMLNDANVDLKGNVNRIRGTLSFNGRRGNLSDVKMNDSRISFAVQSDSIGLKGTIRLSANISNNQMLGVGETASGQFFTWQAHRTDLALEQSKSLTNTLPDLQLPNRYPSMEFGQKESLVQPTVVLIKNAIIWTQGDMGVLENADMLAENGKIVKIGQNLSAPRHAQIIDAKGKHITPGLIDPHMHSSIGGGVNEVGDAITSEVRIADVLETNDIWIYRQLAGGLTAGKLFHGSANPIGGQDAAVKMRWGALPSEILIEDAMPGLKFALGENVKRLQGRYPSSRQGTEQIIKDYFHAALEYQKSMDSWNANKRGLPVRKNLQLEPILEVLQGKRKAHIHAYRQDEMLMTIRLAEEFGFTVGSFEHALEGYKIADELKLHGAAAVVWSDWSSFKLEAYDGILNNAKLLNDVGVLTSLHSDNTQLSTRLNWEAAKSLRSDVSEVDAMNLITINPARIMGIDHRTGSLEVGKDADFVIWNGHPLSSFSTPDQTWVHGIKYFDKENDKLLREEVMKERTLIINRIQEIKQNSKPE
jgi:imidazolonepropionase-like amidohydrolase